MKNRYFIEIRKASGSYEARIHQEDPDKAQSLPALAVGPDIELLADPRHSLGSLVERLIRFDTGFFEHVFDERLQLDLGRHLYDQTLGQLDDEHPPSEGDIQVWIVTADEHVARLPWVLLARGGRFLCASCWSVALSQLERKHESCELPPSPRMLIVMPQPAGEPDTRAKAHLEDLELLLSSADHHFERGKNMQVAATWAEFRRLVKEFQPELLYYYGHGVGDQRTSRLLFARGKTRKRHDVPVADIAQCLREAGNRPPLLAYVNCCLGDAGGLLGAGWQLGDVVPAVVTNRTVAFIEAAQLQARHFWRAVLLDGTTPHKAVAEMYGHLGDMGLSFRDARWMTPVLHRHYDYWESNPPKPSQRISDPHWHVKFDRVRHFGQVLFQTQEVLRNRKPPCLAYLWYGEEGQGIEQFHQRLKVELPDYVGTAHLYEVRPRWPEELGAPYLCFEDMMLEAFDVLSLDDVPARIRSQTRGEPGRDIVVYVRHEPIRRGEVVKPKHLKSYLEWWDDVFAPLLREAPAFGLLGISFVVDNPPRFLQILKKNKIENLALRQVVFHPLDEMERVAKKDLRDFLLTHNVELPRGIKDRILDDILEKTKGHYEMTLDALRDLVNRAWDEKAGEEDVDDVDEDEDNW